MKIKTVCEMTGLTDRAVRHYIEEGLVSPHTEETYIGRRIFDFNEGDVRLLSDIAILRKYGFSIGEIRDMLQNAEAIAPSVDGLKERKKALLEVEETLYERLCDEALAGADSVSQLASLLAEPVEKESVPREDNKWNIGNLICTVILRMLIRILSFVPAVLSIGFLIESTIKSLIVFAYPKISGALPFCILSFLLSIFMFIPFKRKKKTKGIRIARVVAFILIVLLLPLSVWGPIGYSETNDIRDYRRLDADCLANRYLFYQELFPTWPHYFEWDSESRMSVYLDAKYHYYYFPFFDYTYDIYAEWPLRKKDFDSEVARVKALFEKEGDYEVIEKEQYTCLVIMEGTSRGKPFEPVTDSYTIYIFAYDEENLRVRYILCDSLENGVDQPYYLELDW